MHPPHSKILVVDDSDDIREFFSFILERAGYSVTTATNGEEAFAKLRSERPDVVILDVVMPRMDGLELLLKLRSDLVPPLPPVILCSGFDLTEEEALRRGAAHFLRKPIEPQDLLAVVDAVLSGHAASAEVIATQHMRVDAARLLSYETARMLLQRIERNDKTFGERLGQRAFGHVSVLASYLDVCAVAICFLRDERLKVAAVSDSSWLPHDADLGEILPPVWAVLETGSALVLPDAQAHPSFASACGRLDGIRAFVGVPVVVEKTPVGVLCVVADQPRDFQPEDLAIIQIFSDVAAAVLNGRANQRPDDELPMRYGAGMAPRPQFEEMLDAELRLLDRHGGSMELAVLDVADAGVLQKAIISAAAKERLFGGALHDQRVAVYKRSPTDNAASQLRAVLTAIRSAAEVAALGVIDLTAGGLHPFSAADLLRLAERVLDRTLEKEEAGIQRLVIEERPGEA